MTLFPDAQLKAQDEINRVVGNDRLPDLADRDSLPYVNALFNEVLRWRPVVPTGLSKRYYLMQKRITATQGAHIGPPRLIHYEDITFRKARSLFQIYGGSVKLRDASAGLTRLGICFMTPRYIPIRNISIQSGSLQEIINLRNQIPEHVSLASDGGKSLLSMHSMNSHTSLSTKNLRWYVYLRDLCRVFNGHLPSDLQDNNLRKPRHGSQ
jgi:Cytochrome P450